MGCSHMTVYRLCNDLIKPKNNVLEQISEILEMPVELLERALVKTNYNKPVVAEYQAIKKVLEQIAVENPSLSVADRETLLRASIIISELDAR